MRILLLSALFAVASFAQSRGAGHAPPAARPRTAPPVFARPVAQTPYYPRTILVPYPAYIGGVGYGYGSGYTDQTPIGVVNQNFQPDTANPSIVDYSNVPLPQPVSDDDTQLKDDQPTIFLIALTDHTVLAAIAYWVDGDTLHWVSRDAKINQLSVSLVDRDFSKQLNDERHVDFKLPPAK